VRGHFKVPPNAKKNNADKVSTSSKPEQRHGYSGTIRLAVKEWSRRRCPSGIWHMVPPCHDDELIMICLSIVPLYHKENVHKKNKKAATTTPTTTKKKTTQRKKKEAGEETKENNTNKPPASKKKVSTTGWCD